MEEMPRHLSVCADAGTEPADGPISAVPGCIRVIQGLKLAYKRCMSTPPRYRVSEKCRYLRECVANANWPEVPDVCADAGTEPANGPISAVPGCIRVIQGLELA